MCRLPALGPRGEGWVVIQLVIFAAIAVGGGARPGAWTGPGAGLAVALGWLLVVTGIVLGAAGMAGLQGGDALTAVPHPRDEARLVEHGAYRLVRHPIYGGLILAATGWALARASIVALAAAALLFVFFDLKRRREEAWLVARFPGYAAYRARTHRLIPWIW
jgi:protein-S-isoprenylcysteine O-methyltransferase Ste14